MKKGAVCSACLGSGRVPDHAGIGRRLRRTRRVSLAMLARRMKISSAHLCLLEQGKRSWNDKLLDSYHRHNHL